MLHTELIRPLGELLKRHVAQRGDRSAFRDERRTVSWAQLERRTAALAVALRARAGSRATVAICMPSCVEGAESYLGVVRAGCLAAYLNPSASDSELAYMLDHCGAEVLICDERHARRTWELAEKVPDLRELIVVGGSDTESPRSAVDYEQLIAGASGPAPDDLALDEPAFLLYTSGTTGRPKGVVLTQRSCLWVVAACWTTALGLTAEDDVLSALPLFHSYALVLTVLAIVATGASERLLPRFSVHRALEALRDERVTVLAGVPTMFHHLVGELGDRPLDAAALRVSVSAGAIMAGTLMQAFEQASGAPLLDGYGITETSTMVTISWPGGERPPGSCGLPVPGCAVRLVDPGSGEDVAFGEEGELIVRGPQVMHGYLDDDEATAAALQGGWYHSGDLARSDPHGYLTITGRIKELIIRGGENIYPAEVEQVVAEHPAIADAAVIGVPDEALGETVLAFIVLAGDDVDDDELRRFAAARLADYKVPERFARVPEIPRTGSGKVQRHKLSGLA